MINPIHTLVSACAGEPELPRCTVNRCRVYPRVCGGTFTVDDAAAFENGLSPRVRGNLQRRMAYGPSNRSIPACAGEPRRPMARLWQLRVYPRVCGGTFQDFFDGFLGCGLSPRVRGNQPDPPSCYVQPRSIPACAGEPFATLVLREPRRVYPRVCGGTAMNKGVLPGCTDTGLSPRVRGNLTGQSLSPDAWGSIPACAGEPTQINWRY